MSVIDCAKVDVIFLSVVQNFRDLISLQLTKLRPTYVSQSYETRLFFKKYRSKTFLDVNIYSMIGLLICNYEQWQEDGVQSLILR